MNPVKIITDSTADLSQELISEFEGVGLENIDEHTVRVRGSSISGTPTSGGNFYANRRRERTEKQKGVQQAGPECLLRGK